MTRLLIVDDDPGQLAAAAEVAATMGYRADTATGGAEALRRLRGDRGYAAVLLDLVMPDMDGMAVLETLAREHVDIPVIVGLATPSAATVATAIHHGAHDFFIKPLTADRLLVALTRALEQKRLNAGLAAERGLRRGAVTLSDMIAGSSSMERVRIVAERAARSPLPLLIEGEGGTGKQRLAHIVHSLGDRAGKPFVTLDCASLEPQLAEAILFGCRKGALPGARTDIEGKLVEAHGGTLYLDQIGELPPALQARLLDVLHSGEVTPLGAARPERANVRLIAATSQRLLNLAKAGHVREDLHHRLNVMPVYLPPLRDRRDDLGAIVAGMLPALAAEAGRRVASLAPAAMDLLARYDWPGNLRQLEDALYRAIIHADGAQLQPADFPLVAAQVLERHEAVRLAGGRALPSAPVHIDAAIPERRSDEQEVMRDRFLDEQGRLRSWEDIERELIAFALEHHQGRMSAVARALRMGRSTVYRKLRDYGLGETVENEIA